MQHRLKVRNGMSSLAGTTIFWEFGIKKLFNLFTHVPSVILGCEILISPERQSYVLGIKKDWHKPMSLRIFPNYFLRWAKNPTCSFECMRKMVKSKTLNNMFHKNYSELKHGMYPMACRKYNHSFLYLAYPPLDVCSNKIANENYNK